MSLASLTDLSISDDKTTVTFGTGNIWTTIYQFVEQQEVAVAGGRYPTVGVGGLSIGGGASFVAAARGWTCDNIVSYQLVTADGEIIQVSNSSFPDLHWALHGGGNNLGIVTKITMEAFPLPGEKLWGGLRIYEESEFLALIQAAYNLGTTGAATDPGVGQIISFGVAGSLGATKLGLATLSYAEPVEKPLVMAEFLAIPAVSDTTQIRMLTNLTEELAGGNALGQDSTHKFRSRGTATFQLNTEFMTYAKDVCFDEFGKLADVAELDAFCVFQVITQ